MITIAEISAVCGEALISEAEAVDFDIDGYYDTFSFRNAVIRTAMRRGFEEADAAAIASAGWNACAAMPTATAEWRRDAAMNMGVAAVCPTCSGGCYSEGNQCPACHGAGWVLE